MSTNPVWLIGKFCTLPNHWSDWTSSLAMQFLNWVRYVPSARFQRSLSLCSVWYDGGLARGEKAFVVRKKDGHPFQGWLSTCGHGVKVASCLAFRALQSGSDSAFPRWSPCASTSDLGVRRRVGGRGRLLYRMPCKLQIHPCLLTCFPQALETPSKHSLPTSPVETVTCVQWGSEVAGRGP